MTHKVKAASKHIIVYLNSRVARWACRKCWLTGQNKYGLKRVTDSYMWGWVDPQKRFCPFFINIDIGGCMHYPKPFDMFAFQITFIWPNWCKTQPKVFSFHMSTKLQLMSYMIQFLYSSWTIAGVINLQNTNSSIGSNEKMTMKEVISI